MSLRKNFFTYTLRIGRKSVAHILCWCDAHKHCAQIGTVYLFLEVLVISFWNSEFIHFCSIWSRHPCYSQELGSASLSEVSLLPKAVFESAVYGILGFRKKVKSRGQFYGIFVTTTNNTLSRSLFPRYIILQLHSV